MLQRCWDEAPAARPSPSQVHGLVRDLVHDPLSLPHLHGVCPNVAVDFLRSNRNSPATGNVWVDRPQRAV